MLVPPTFLMVDQRWVEIDWCAIEVGEISANLADGRLLGARHIGAVDPQLVRGLNSAPGRSRPYSRIGEKRCAPMKHRY
jgi:hypothetical protein